MDQAKSFYDLRPDQILSSIEKHDMLCTGQILQLNSYENRVFLVYLEDAPSVVAKFYRPNRWNYNSLKEEHNFLFDLKAEGIPVVAPLILSNKDSVDKVGEIFYSLFPVHKGRMPDELLQDDYAKIGRSLARMHNIGEQKDFHHRPNMDGQEFGWNELDSLEDWVDPIVWSQYKNISTHIINGYIDLTESLNFQRIHGDCHRGNLLDNGQEFFFVDFDDSVMGPVAQDLWMLVAGNENLVERDTFFDAYSELRSLPKEQFKLFPYLQAMRIIRYSAWIGKRWEDPSFPVIFPNFTSYSYWADELENLRRISESL